MVIVRDSLCVCCAQVRDVENERGHLPCTRCPPSVGQMLTPSASKGVVGVRLGPRVTGGFQDAARCKKVGARSCSATICRTTLPALWPPVRLFGARRISGMRMPCSLQLRQF